MKILHVIDHMGCGGAQTALIDALRCWPDSNDRITVLSLGKQSLYDEMFSGLQAVNYVRLGLGRWNPLAVSRVISYCRRENWDVAHSHLSKSTGSLALASQCSDFRWVVHLQCDLSVAPGLRAVIRVQRNRVDSFIAVSERAAQSARRLCGIPSEKVAVVPNGVDSERLRLNVRAPSFGAELRPRREGVFRVIFAGRLHRVKGILTLLKAMRQLGPSVELAIIGEGTQRFELEEYVRAHQMSDRIFFAGVSSETARWLVSADVVVLPTLSEGLPMIVLEAFQIGTPVIATVAGGLEQLITDGQTGLRIRQGNVGDLVNAIRLLMSSRGTVDRLKSGAFARVQQGFQARSTARHIRDVYLSLMSG